MLLGILDESVRTVEEDLVGVLLRIVCPALGGTWASWGTQAITQACQLLTEAQRVLDRSIGASSS